MHDYLADIEINAYICTVKTQMRLRCGRRKRPIFMPVEQLKKLQTAPSVVADNAHKGFAFETLTARSAVFHFMSKYQMYEKGNF